MRKRRKKDFKEKIREFALYGLATAVMGFMVFIYNLSQREVNKFYECLNKVKWTSHVMSVERDYKDYYFDPRGRVIKRDTIWGLCKEINPCSNKHYTDCLKECVDSVIEKNQIKDPNAIREGYVIEIPDKKSIEDCMKD